MKVKKILLAVICWLTGWSIGFAQTTGAEDRAVWFRLLIRY